jgi:hypothetical protein
MARDYGKVLDAAERLMNFTGYLDAEDRKQQGVAQGKFNGEVRVFVYNMFRESPDHGALAYSVSADLDRIGVSGRHSADAVADARAALLAEIAKRSRNSSLMRFLIRWGAPVLGFAGIAAFAYFKWHLFG